MFDEQNFTVRCCKPNCNNPVHKRSMYCLEHLRHGNLPVKSERELRWAAQYSEKIKEELKERDEQNKINMSKLGRKNL